MFGFTCVKIRFAWKIAIEAPRVHIFPFTLRATTISTVNRPVYNLKTIESERKKITFPADLVRNTNVHHQAQLLRNAIIVLFYAVYYTVLKRFFLSIRSPIESRRIKNKYRVMYNNVCSVVSLHDFVFPFDISQIDYFQRIIIIFSNCRRNTNISL